MSIKVAIVDDDEGVRRNLVYAVDHFETCKCVGQFASAEEAFRGIPICQPEIVLMDINMPQVNGIECVQKLKSTYPSMEFIMLTVYEDTESVFKALAAGASGYLLKQSTREELFSAIKQVCSGGSPMTSHIARKVVQSFRQPVSSKDPMTTLTQREQETLDLLARGFLYKEIADMLDISYETVHNHIRHIYVKLHVRSRAQAVAKYFHKGK
jgi:DNA-binding NarL/FixJ family response regulator